MIKLTVELQDWDDGYADKDVTLPSANIHSELSRQNQYVIIDSEPPISGVQSMDIWELNDILDEINSENPGMTAELLSLIADTVDGDLEDEEFVRRIKENDFMFIDLSDDVWDASNEEAAVRHIIDNLGVPFCADISNEVLKFITKDELSDYINWDAIWAEYESLGFRLAEDIESEDYGLYLIHWR